VDAPGQGSGSGVTREAHGPADGVARPWAGSETIEATLVSTSPDEHGLEALIDLDHDDLVREVIPASELEGVTQDSPIAYRAVPALPFFGAVGPGAAIPGSSLFFALLFLVCCLAGTVATAAVLLEGE